MGNRGCKMIYFKCRKTNKSYCGPTDHYPVVNKDLRYLLNSGFLKIPNCECIHECSKNAKPL